MWGKTIANPGRCPDMSLGNALRVGAGKRTWRDSNPQPFDP